MKKETIMNFLNENSQSILTGVGIGGIILTSFSLIKSTIKAKTKIDKLQIEKLDNKEIFKIVWKDYIFSTVSLSSSIACIFLANRINEKKIAAMATAYKMSETAYSKYRDKVKETIGEKKETEIRDKIAQDKITDDFKQNKIAAHGNGKQCCKFELLDDYGYFYGDVDAIKRAMIEVSNKLNSDMFVSVNDIIYELNKAHGYNVLKEMKTLDNLCWNVDYVGYRGLPYHITTCLLDTNEMCAVLVIDEPPM